MRFTEFISEDANPKRQAAIAIAMKKAGKKPKGVTEQTVTETAEELQELTQFSKGMADFLAKSYTQYIKNPQTAKYVQQQISQPITDGATYRALMPAIGIVSVPGADAYTSPGLVLAKKFVSMVVAYFPTPGDADYNGFSEAAPAVYDARSRTVVINKDYLSDPTYLASTIAHEVQHGIDDLKSRKGLSVKTDQLDLELSHGDQGKAFKYKQSAGATDNAQKYQSYLAMPHEVNARFTEVINDIKQRIEKEDIQNIGSAGLSDLARSAFKQHYMHEVFPNGAKDPGYKRLLSRVYAWISKYYNDRIDRYGSFKPQPATPVLDEQGVAEGSSDNIPTMGINVRSDGDIDYASLIVDGEKKYESRKTDSLRPYVGKIVGIVRTGNGPAVAIGQVTIGEPIIVDAEKFNRFRKQHLVPQGSKFDIDSDGTKYLYPMIDPVRWDNEKPIKHRGIVSRKIQEQGVAEGWSQKYKKSINCSHPKGFSQKAHCAGKKKHNESIDNVMEMTCPDCGMCQTHGDNSKDKLDELKCWSGYHRVKGTTAGFPGSCAKNKTNEEQVLENLHKWFKEKWVRFGPDGKIRGDCARGSESEGKPKCLPQSKAHSLGKKGRASAASRKRREDPNANRSGKAINVSTKGKGK